MNKELDSRSEVRSLRNRKKIDYKKMSDGESQISQEAEQQKVNVGQIGTEVDFGDPLVENPSGASGLSARSGTEQPVIGSEFDVVDFDREQDEAEIVEIQLQMKRLNAEEARMERKRRLDQMRRELHEQKQRVRDMKGNPSQNCDPVVKPKVRPAQSKLGETVSKTKSAEAKSSSKLSLSSSGAVTGVISESDTDQLTIDDLRKNPKLQKKVQKELNKLGLKCIAVENESSCESDSSNSSCSTQSDSSCKKKKKHRKHKKSGINAKSSDKVKDPQRWPHAYLQYEFVNKQVKFDELDFKLFLAGEISIISSDDLTESERKGRLDLLKKIIYYSNTYEFKGLKAFYAAWLREIELGKKSWSDDPQQLETAILSKYLLKNKGSSSFMKKDFSNKSDATDDKTWFCSEYQRNKCKHKSSHLRVHNGKQKLASHICATCWLKDKKKLEHPECSSSCPHLAD